MQQITGLCLCFVLCGVLLWLGVIFCFCFFLLNPLTLSLINQENSWDLAFCFPEVCLYRFVLCVGITDKFVCSSFELCLWDCFFTTCPGKLKLSEECTSGQPLASPNYMCTSNIEVRHTLPLSFSLGGWCHFISDGNASALKVQGEALVLRPTLFCSTHYGEGGTTLISEVFTVWKYLYFSYLF